MCCVVKNYSSVQVSCTISQSYIPGACRIFDKIGLPQGGDFYVF